MISKMLFTRTPHPAGGSVYLQTGWMPAFEFELLSEAYHSAANACVEALAKDDTFFRAGSGSTAFRALPVIFLYRQALELLLKAIIHTGSSLLDESDGVAATLREHNFEKLRPLVEKIHEKCNLGWNFGVPTMRTVDDFRRLVSEFDAFDSDSTVSRYPVNGAGGPAIADPTYFNLFVFAEHIDAALDVLNTSPLAVRATLERSF